MGGGIDIRACLERVSSEVGDLFDGRRVARVSPRITAGEIRDALSVRYGHFERAVDPRELISDVARMLREWNIDVTHPRYLGLFNPSVHEVGVAADALVAAFNPQLAAWAHAPGSNEIERATLLYLAARLGLGVERLHVTFTTEGAEANHSAVLVALTRTFPAYRQGGLRALDRRPALYLSASGHHSFEKIASTIQWSRRHIGLKVFMTSRPWGPTGSRPFWIIRRVWGTTCAIRCGPPAG